MITIRMVRLYLALLGNSNDLPLSIFSLSVSRAIVAKIRALSLTPDDRLTAHDGHRKLAMLCLWFGASEDPFCDSHVTECWRSEPLHSRRGLILGNVPFEKVQWSTICGTEKHLKMSSWVLEIHFFQVWNQNLFIWYPTNFSYHLNKKSMLNYQTVCLVNILITVNQNDEQ